LPFCGKKSIAFYQPNIVFREGINMEPENFGDLPVDSYFVFPEERDPKDPKKFKRHLFFKAGNIHGGCKGVSIVNSFGGLGYSKPEDPLKYNIYSDSEVIIVNF
jgi:hypothetical protein